MRNDELNIDVFKVIDTDAEKVEFAMDFLVE